MPSIRRHESCAYVAENPLAWYPLPRFFNFSLAEITADTVGAIGVRHY
jgi:hypothetical protein